MWGVPYSAWGNSFCSLSRTDGFLYGAARIGELNLKAMREKRWKRPRLLTTLRVAHLTYEVFFHGHIIVRFIVNRAKKLSPPPFLERFSTATL
jgi:hypothetical protein